MVLRLRVEVRHAAFVRDRGEDPFSSDVSGMADRDQRRRCVFRERCRCSTVEAIRQSPRPPARTRGTHLDSIEESLEFLLRSGRSNPLPLVLPLPLSLLLPLLLSVTFSLLSRISPSPPAVCIAVEVVVAISDAVVVARMNRRRSRCRAKHREE